MAFPVRLPKIVAAQWFAGIPILVAASIAAAAAYFVLVWIPDQRAAAVESVASQLDAAASRLSLAADMWVNQGFADGKWFAALPSVADLLRTGARAAPVARAHLDVILASYARTQGLDWVRIVDRSGVVVAGPGGGGEVEAPERNLLKAVLATGANRADFHAHHERGPRVAFAVPVPGARGAPPVGVVLSETDPQRWLYPVFDAAPMAAPTSEALLIQRTGDSICFAVRLLKHPAPPLTVCRALGEGQHLLAHAALGGAQRLTAFRDYAGDEVYGSVRRIEDAPWVVEVKVDVSDALVAYRREVRSAAISWGTVLLSLAAVALLLWRRQLRASELSLARGQARTAAALDQAADMVLFVGLDGRIKVANRRAEEFYGGGPGGLIGRQGFELRPAETRSEVPSLLASIREGASLVFETEHLTADGTPVPVEVSTRRVHLDGGDQIVSVIRDIRERKAAEAQVLRLNRMLRTLSEINQLMIRERDPAQVFQVACRVIVEHAGFRMAWIGCAEPDGAVRALASAGAVEGYLDAVRIRWDDTPEGRGPTGDALREGRSVTLNDVANAPSYRPWAAAAGERGYRASGAFPIRVRDEVWAVLNVYAAETGVFDVETVSLLEELAGDLGFALKALEDGAARRSAEDEMHASARRLSAILDAAPVPIIAMAPGGLVTSWNPAAERVFGWSAEEVVGRPNPTIPPERREELAEEVARASAGNAVVGLATQRTRRDGTPIEVLVSTAALPEASGPAAGLVALLVDLTELRRTEAALRAREAQFSLVHDNAYDVIFVISVESDGRFRFLSVNRRFLEVTGLAEDQIVGKLVQEVIPEPAHALVLGKYQEAIRGKQPAHWEEVSVYPAGTRAGEVTVAPVFDAAGTCTQLIGTVHDITERRRAEEALRASERKYRALFTESRDGIFIAEAANSALLDANGALIGMSGLPLELLRGTPLLSLIAPEHVPAARQAWEATMRGGEMGATEVDIVRADGTHLPVEVRANAYTEADGVVRLFGVVRNISERRQREEEMRESTERYRRVVEGAPEGIVIHSDGKFAYLNPAALQMIGASSAEQLIGRPVAERLDPETKAKYGERLRTVADSRVTTPQTHMVFLRLDGTPFDVESSGAPITHEGRPSGLAFFRDITDRLAAEAAAEESTERFRLVVESTPDGVLIHTDSIIRYANPAAVRIYGAESADALVGTPMLERVSAEFRDVVRQRIATINSGRGDAEALEEVLLRVDGSPFRAEVKAVRFPQGGKTSVLVLVRDITQRIATEQALREGEERFHQVVEGGPEALFTSANMRFTYLNPAALRLFGATSAKDVVGRPTLERISPEYHALVRKRLERLLVDGLPTPTTKEVFIRLDGTTFDVEANSVAFPLEGGKGVLTFFRDITERKRAEEELALVSTALTQSGEVALIADLEGTIQFVNPAFERVTGYSAAEAVGQNPRILKSGAQGPEVYREMWDTLTSGRVFAGTFVNRRKNGDHYVAEVVVSPVRNAAGEVTHYVGQQRDVTREHDLEEQLRQAQKMEAVGQLTGGIAHDFNNLLGVILANTSLLGAALEGQASEPLGYLEDIEKAAEAGSAMVKKLLAFGRRERLAPTPVALGRAVRQLEQTLHRFLPETVIIRVDVAEPGPSALADSGALEQMLLNLATNARDAMEGGGTLTIAVREVEFQEADTVVLQGIDRPGRYACLSVSDTGAGMDAATQERIFEPFFTTKPAGAGTGLGLPMVFGLMKQHGGFVRVYSEPGQGTAVRLYFPAVAAAANAPARVAEPERRLRGTETLLVVEDQEMLRRATARALEKLGYQILVASDGAEGLRAFTEHAERVRLVISDRVMPELGGVELYRCLRDAGHDVPFLLMSGYAADAGGITPVPEGLTIIEKPWTVEDLASRVRALLDGPPPT